MKAGSTGYLKVTLTDLGSQQLDLISEVIFTLKSRVDMIAKRYPSEVTFSDGKFFIALDQQETLNLSGYFKIEAQINFVDNSVSKSEIKQEYMDETLATKFLSENVPSEVEIDINLDVEPVQIVRTGGGGGDSYTKAESDARYAQKGDAYTKSESDEKFALKGEGGVSDEQIANAVEDYLTENPISGSGDVSTKIFIDTLYNRRPKDFAWRAMPTAQIALVIDDCTAGVISAVTNAKNKNVPLCLAPIIENFTLTSNGETVLEACKRCIANGGEVLMHGKDSLEADDIQDEEVLKNHFLVQKETLIGYGFNPRGAILVGGGTPVRFSPITDRWVRALFDYSDQYGTSEPYKHTRYDYTTLEDAKIAIDNAVANKTFLVIFSHNWKSFWGEMIDYAKSKGANFTNYADVYDLYGTTRQIKALEDRLIALEGGVVVPPSDEPTDVACTNVSLNKTAISFTSANATETLIATLTPSNTTDTLEWSSSDNNVATVDNGIVTSVANGEAIITATCGSQSSACSINVAISESGGDGEETDPLYITELPSSRLMTSVGSTNNTYASSNDSQHIFIYKVSSGSTYNVTSTVRGALITASGTSPSDPRGGLGLSLATSATTATVTVGEGHDYLYVGCVTAATVTVEKV